MKAIHNAGCAMYVSTEAVFDMSKIKNESNSQRVPFSLAISRAVFDMSKIKNESNSQRCHGSSRQRLRCI